MFAAYGAAGALGVGPAVASRRRTIGQEIARAHLAPPVEAGWVAVQAFVALTTLLCAAAPGWVESFPFTWLESASSATLWAGTGVFVAGAATTGWAARTLGRQLTASIEVRSGDELVTAGPYARVRHPIYTGIFLMTGGLAVALLDPVAASVFLLAVAIGSHRARREEDLLARDETHGTRYRDYRGGTGRFLPRLR